MYLNPQTPAVRKRQGIEVSIVKAVVVEALGKGYWLSVYDGETRHAMSRNPKTLYSQLIETDEDYLFVLDADGKELGWIRFIYGNDGYDVISDYTVNLETILGPANHIAARAEARCQ